MSQDSEGPVKRLSLSASRLTLGADPSNKAGRRTVQVEVRRRRQPAAPLRRPRTEEESRLAAEAEVAHTFAEKHIAIKKLMNEMKKPLVPWTVDSHQKHPETRMWHDRVGWDNPKSESRFRMGEDITKKEIEANRQIPAKDCKTVEEVMGLIPNLRRIGHSSRLKADMNRLFDYAREDTWSKHVFNESFVSKRPDVRGGKWTRHMRPLGAKVLVRFLVHVGPEFYIDGDIDLRELRKYASSADIVEEPPATNDNKIVPEPETDGVERYARVKQRTGQQSLRQHMLSLAPTCPFTGVENPRMLKTSHIKPNAHCGYYERDGRVLHEKDDGANVLMLTPTADWLFDQGYVSFTEEGKLMRSTEITGADYRAMGLSHDASIEHLLDGPVGERRQGYMEHHRRFIFRGPNKEEWRG